MDKYDCFKLLTSLFQGEIVLTEAKITPNRKRLEKVYFDSNVPRIRIIKMFFPKAKTFEVFFSFSLLSHFKMLAKTVTSEHINNTLTTPQPFSAKE